MTQKLTRIALLATSAAAAIGLSDAHAQSATTSNTQYYSTQNDTVGEVVVTARGQGTRDARQSNLQTVDAIGPKDIDSLPSQNLSDVLKRLPGVQVTYDNGEAQQPNIRGVGFVQTLIDGREAVTAGFRSLQIGDIPDDIVNAVEVYKSQSADQIEGGIGGIVNIRTKQPNEYHGFGGRGSLTGSLDDKKGKLSPQGSIAIGDSWETGAGRIGFTLGAAHTEIKLISDFALTDYGSATTQFDANHNGVVGDAGDALIAPADTFPIEIQVQHKRDVQNANFQWQPNDKLDLRASVLHSKYIDNSGQFYLVGIPDATNAPQNYNAFTVYPNTNIVSSGTFTNANVIAESLWVRPQREVTQEALSATYTSGPAKISVGADFTQSRFDEDIFIFSASATAPSMVYKGAVSPDMPSATYPGLNVLDPAVFGNMRYTDILQRQESRGDSQRLDLEYDFNGPFLRSVQIGGRLNYRRSVSNQASGGGPVSGTLASQGLGRISPNGDFVNADPFLFRDDSAFRQKVGLSPSLPTNSPANYFLLREKTRAAYVRALYDFSVGGIAIDGDFGVRVVRSLTSGEGFAVGGASGPIPITTGGRSTDVLPSSTLRAKLTDKLILRITGSKVMGRPTLAQLSPGVRLGTTGAGSAGNPNLKPFYATGADVGLDWFFNRAGYATIALFTKRVQGFVANEISSETFGGVPYQISRPINSGKGTLRGVEINYSQKFVFLPGLLSGLGVDANYTYIESSQISAVTGRKQQITGLANNTWNLSAYYDHGPLLIRAGYAITSKFINNDDLGAPFDGPEVFGRQDVLDGTIQYSLSPHIKLTANVMNALQPHVGYYNTIKQTPNNSYRTYRRYQAGVKFDF